jgi:hypothetical protein
MYDIFSILLDFFFLLYTNVYHFTCTDMKMPGNSEVCTSLQNCESSVWKLLCVTLLTAKILENLCTIALNTFINSAIKKPYCLVFYKEAVIVSLFICSTYAFHLAIINQVGSRSNISNMYFVRAKFKPQLRP